MLARKAITKPKNTGLKPTPTGGKLYLPGFHRTRQESAAASIVVDSLKPGRPGCLYGAGFYMARTLANQKRETMVSNYGKHIVRCRVDVSRFICFDKAVAKRVWGDQYLLKDQLVSFGPWSKDDLTFIDACSKGLAAFWEDKKSKDAVYENKWAHYGRPGTKRRRPLYNTTLVPIQNSSDIAKIIYQTLHLDKKVPGILYTGASDGACVLAYHLDRVTPLAMALAPKGIKAKDMVWLDATNRLIKRKHAPDLAMKDDIATYTQRLKMTGQRMTVAQKIAMIEDSYNQLPHDPHDQLAFCIALIRVCRHPSLHEIRDGIMGTFAASITKMLYISMPKFTQGVGSMGIPRLSVGVFNDDEDDDDEEGSDTEARGRGKKYRALIAHHAILWDFIRYQVFLDVDAAHRFLLTKTMPLLEQEIKRNNDHRIRIFLGGLFGGIYISRYGDVMFTHSKNKNHLYLHEPTEGIKHLSDILTRRRSISGYLNGTYHTKKIYPKKVSLERKGEIYDLIGKDEYLQFMRSQLLKLYTFLKKHPVGKDPTVKKILGAWWRKHGKDHKAKVDAHSAYHEIGGKTLEPDS